jgi:hypothetical protein
MYLCYINCYIIERQRLWPEQFTRTHDESKANVVKHDRWNPEKDVGQADEHEPVPDDEVHLLVDDVLREDAEAVVVLESIF